MRCFALILAVLAAFPLAAADMAGPYIPTDAERARWTMFDMNSWKVALAAYKLDHGNYPAAGSLEEARGAIEPVYIVHAAMNDAWGNPYRYEVDGKGGFRIVSAGADGKFEPASWSTGGHTKSFSDDVVATGEGKWLFRLWDLR